MAETIQAADPTVWNNASFLVNQTQQHIITLTQQKFVSHSHDMFFKQASHPSPHIQPKTQVIKAFQTAAWCFQNCFKIGHPSDPEWKKQMGECM